MTIFTKYILSKFLKYFFIILISLELFFVGIDFIQNVKHLPNSANLQLLYLLYNGFYTLTITLPLSLVFGWIITLTSLIKNNELVSFYSLGIYHSKILGIIINISLVITFVLIALQATPMAYSYEQKKKISKNQYFTNAKSNIFLKYNNYYVYFKKLYPFEKKATDVHIFKTKNNDIVESIVAKKAYYQNNKWYIVDAIITKKPDEIDWQTSKLDIKYEKFLHILDGFEPKIINNVYKSDISFSILDAIKAILLLNDQNFNINKIKAILYSQLFQPFFILPLFVLIYLFVSPSSRFFNSAKFISGSIFLTLVIWGMMFLLQKLALGGVIMAEVAIILPIVLLCLITYYFYMKELGK